MEQELLSPELENMKLRINQELLINYGPHIKLGNIENIDNQFKLGIDYVRIFNLFNQVDNTLYIRDIRFHNIHALDLKLNEELKLPRKELNISIQSEYNKLTNNILHKVLDNKSLVLKLIKNVHIFSSFLNKFHTLINFLVIEDLIPASQVRSLIYKDKKYEKYIDLLLSMDIAKFNSKKNLVASNLLKQNFKENKADIKKTVDDVLYAIIKDHFDYIVYKLKIYNLKSFINVISCICFYYRNLNLKDMKIELSRFYETYTHLYRGINFYRLLDKIRELVYAGIVLKEENYIKLNPQLL